MNYIQEETSLHHYRTEIPNIVFEMNLTPYEFAAYCHMKRTAGDGGICYKTCQRLSDEIGCHRSKFIEIKKSLQEKGLIKIFHRKKEDGGSTSDVITIIDLWPLNMRTMAERKSQSTAPVAIGDPPLSPITTPPVANNDPKKEHILRRTQNNNKQPLKSIKKDDFVVVPSFIDEIDGITEEDKICLSEIETKNEGCVALAIKWAKTQKVKTTKMALIRWHAERKKKIEPVKKKGDVETNKAYADSIAKIFKKPGWKIDVYNAYVEIKWDKSNQAYIFDYKDLEFEEKINDKIENIKKMK